MTLHLRLMRLLMIFSPIRFYFMSFQSTCEAAAQRRQPTVFRVVVQSFKFRAPLLISRNLVNLSIAPKSSSSVHAFSLTTPAKIPSIIHLPFIETSRTLAILTIPGNNKHLLVSCIRCINLPEKQVHSVKSGRTFQVLSLCEADGMSDDNYYSLKIV